MNISGQKAQSLHEVSAEGTAPESDTALLGKHLLPEVLLEELRSSKPDRT